jgi:hypothetical protein
LPLQLDHGPIFNSWGVTDRLGYARRFAVVSYPVSGLLAVGADAMSTFELLAEAAPDASPM